MFDISDAGALRNDSGAPSTPSRPLPPTTCAESALRFAKEGIPVLPIHTIRNGICSCGKPACTSPAKHPISSLVPRGLNDATTDPEIIAHWWRTFPDANVAIRTGAISRIAAIDIDPRHGGSESLSGIQGTEGAGEDTVTVDTGGGGMHFLYEHPGTHMPSKAKFGGLPGIDSRGDGGYLIAPPSLHASGKRYQFRAGFALGDLPLAPIPSWVRSRIETPKPNTDAPIQPTSSFVLHEQIPAGTRQDSLFRAACALRARGLDEFEILRVITAINQVRCTPPLEAPEVATAARSAARYTRGNSALPAAIAAAKNSVMGVVFEPIGFLWFGGLSKRSRAAELAILALPDDTEATATFLDGIRSARSQHPRPSTCRDREYKRISRDLEAIEKAYLSPTRPAGSIESDSGIRDLEILGLTRCVNDERDSGWFEVAVLCHNREYNLPNISAKDLSDFKRFRSAAMGYGVPIPSPPKAPSRWHDLVEEAMRRLQVKWLPEEQTRDGQIRAALRKHLHSQVRPAGEEVELNESNAVVEFDSSGQPERYVISIKALLNALRRSLTPLPVTEADCVVVAQYFNATIVERFNSKAPTSIRAYAFEAKYLVAIPATLPADPKAGSAHATDAVQPD